MNENNQLHEDEVNNQDTVSQLPSRIEVIVIQQEMQLLYDIEQAGRILGGMPGSTIRGHVHAGRLRRCEHAGDRPWYFTIKQLEDFTENIHPDDLDSSRENRSLND